MAGNLLARLFGPVNVGNSSTTIATVGAGHTWTLKSIILVNSTAGAISILLGIGGVAAANQILASMSILPGQTITIDTFVVLAAADTLQATTTATGLTITGSGLDQS